MRRLPLLSPFASVARSAAVSLFVVFGTVNTGHAALRAETKRTVIAEVNGLLAELYVIPEMASLIRASLDERLNRGDFDSYSDSEEFAREVTRILYELSGDLHLRVQHGEDLMPADEVRPAPRIVRRVETEGGEPGADSVPRRPADGGPRRVVVREGGPGPGSNGSPGTAQGGTHARDIFEMDGFPRAEVLAGNVGLVEVRLFPPREYAEEAAIAAMKAVEQTDALIFDLRRCMGGSPGMVHLITSYLYPTEPIHLLTYYHAFEDPDSAYTFLEVPGKRHPNTDVYVLTSSHTGSAGEEFSYVLKHHERATLVGETTAGAGHGGATHPISAGFSVFVPDFRPVHPVTGRGWEGVGVTPNVEVPASKALAWAHREILREQLVRGEDMDENERRELEAQVARLTGEIEYEPPRLSDELVREYTGTYAIRTVTAQDGHLYIQREGGPRLKLVPRTEADSFALEVLPDARVDFVRGDSGSVVAVRVRQVDGRWERSERTGV